MGNSPWLQPPFIRTTIRISRRVSISGIDLLAHSFDQGFYRDISVDVLRNAVVFSSEVRAQDTRRHLQPLWFGKGGFIMRFITMPLKREG